MPRAIDRDALAEYLALEYVVAPRTILAGVRKLPPATQLTFDATERQRRHEHATGSCASTARASPATSKTQRSSSRRCCRRRCESGSSPTCRSASSSPAASIPRRWRRWQRASTRGIETFSIAFSDPSFDERTHARAVAAHLGTRHHEEELSLDEAARIVGELGAILDEPVADGSIVPTYLLSRFARRHVTVALGGDGGDELFAGYPTYVAHQLLSWSGPLARPSLVRAASALAARLPVSHDNFSFDFKLKKLTGGAAAPLDERNYWWLGACEPARVAALLGDAAHDPLAAVRARYHEPPSGTHLERVLYQDVGLYLCALGAGQGRPRVDGGVARGARAAARHRRRRVRRPLPLDWKLHRTDRQVDLQARRAAPLAARRSSIARRRASACPSRAGCAASSSRWRAGAHRRAARSPPPARCHGAEIARMLDEHARGDVDHRQRLWALLVLELWRRKNLASQRDYERSRSSSGEHSMTSSQPSALQSRGASSPAARPARRPP